MNYWVIVLPREDMEHCIKIQVFGKNSSRYIKNIKRGDKIVCYASKEQKIIAVGAATSDYYIDNEKVFKADGDYPNRFNLRAVLLGQNEIGVKEIIDDLDYIRKKEYWHAYFRVSPKKITEKDWNTILETARLREPSLTL